MSTKTTTPKATAKPVRLTSARGEKISAVEGLHLTPRMRTVLELSKDKSGDERRKLIKAQFVGKTA
ncbi:hypothetical protein QA648_36805 (plasmid) [Rhizobium sp. CB3171]|uniref:hypothetical protein n=1 Tax=Rhizobium sp. CB3171 TaxID=3039157 RepID=UPI0024B21B87|nr:hypothetical protein [Rhizobium sp. CB3171]WFU07540.1 hypothetical protein QA648_36805 [Rhizobium sp. CB3171]